MRKSKVFVWVALIAVPVVLICLFVKHEIEVRNHQSTTPSPTPPAFQPFYSTTAPPMPAYAPPPLYGFAPPADQKEEDDDDEEEAA
ncbi:hypothetical protein M0R45_016551 [Rubus argutus]|uniref:Uncharacterized protein n=1 Tax=Rubus argutus TaxID=59490 RepID=A0AAW1XVD3_RUBAR